MPTDEQLIRELVATWMQATKAGDVDRVLALMTQDAVFLVPGRVMSKADFGVAARAMSGPNAPKFDGRSDIQEIRVCGDWAYMWSKLTVIVTPPTGRQITRSGHTLTIFRKEAGAWRLARDANLLTVESESEH